ncbi:MAG TPA: rRNA maturation RNase YbeY [Bacilli bacterium]|nr:rRNA maturation RNase YbeY [Bacilli bacterium]
MNYYEVFNYNKYDINIKKINNYIKYCLKYLKIKNVVFNVIFIDDIKMRSINKEYRNIDNTTDVISFALEDNKDAINYNKRLLGDIYISYDKAVEQAKENNFNIIYEIYFLIIHGILHLLGYNHENDNDEKIMFELQEEILNEFKRSKKKLC